MRVSRYNTNDRFVTLYSGLGISRLSIFYCHTVLSRVRVGRQVGRRKYIIVFGSQGKIFYVILQKRNFCSSRPRRRRRRRHVVYTVVCVCMFRTGFDRDYG